MAALFEADIDFPHPTLAGPDGIVYTGGEMTPGNLLKAYEAGIFPWSSRPVNWYCPDPRGVIVKPHLPRNLGKIFRKSGFRVSFDQAFIQVVEGCAESHVDDGCWICEDFVSSYGALHEVGYAHSVEVWDDSDALVGGLYGVQLGGLFAGESMFYRKSNASKIAFAALIEQLRYLGAVMIDCQMVTQQTEKLGAVWITRANYLELLPHALVTRILSQGEKWPAEGFMDDAIFLR